jgi:transcriptional regulator with XRE-family HTH domain
MGRKARMRPKYLAQKLLRIRLALDLSQDGVIEKMGLRDVLTRSRISEYEAGHEPPLPVLLRYAQLANVTVDALIDDTVELPARLPSPRRTDGIRRTSSL